jgi:hypothetical protein
MGRSESSAAFKQSSAQSTQDQNNAQAAFGATNAGLADYSNRLNAYSAANPYKAGGEYDQTIKGGASTASQAGQAGLKADVQNNAIKTGENTAGNASTLAEAHRQASRDLNSFNSQAEADRIGKNSAYQAGVVGMSSVPADMQSRLYGTGVGGATAAGSNASNAARQPGFWETFLPALAGGAGAAAKGFLSQSPTPQASPSGGVGVYN